MRRSVSLGVYAITELKQRQQVEHFRTLYFRVHNYSKKKLYSPLWPYRRRRRRRQRRRRRRQRERPKWAYLVGKNNSVARPAR